MQGWQKPGSWVAFLGLMIGATSLAHAAKDAEVVKAEGQAAIFDGDTSAAKDRAIEDAMRKAVEQTVGTMISSESVSENFELLSDKIYSKSKGYVRKYKVLSERKDGEVLMVTIEAQVSTGNLKGDLDGVMSILRSKDMPRVLIMVAEQNIGQGQANFWWGDKTFATNMDAVENAFIDSWTPKGLSFVDRQALQGKISVGPAVSSADPGDSAIKEFAVSTGAEVVIVGKAVATDLGTIMGTQMRSIRANISIRALNLDTGRIMATSTQSQAVGHIDPLTGGTQALQKAALKAADDILDKMLAQWQSEVTGPLTVSLKVQNIKKSGQVRKLMNIIKDRVRGVKDVRQRAFRGGVAELEVDITGSSQDLATELEEKKLPGFSIEISEITPNAVVAVAK